MEAARAVQRREFPPEVRLTMVEDDLDRVDTGLEALRIECREQAERVLAEARSSRQVLTGILVAVATACIMLAVNVTVIR